MCARDIDGKTARFGTTGYTNNRVFVLYDRNTQSVWHPLQDGTLDAISGEKKGHSIPFKSKPQPQSLKSWLKLHPKSSVLLPDFKQPMRQRPSKVLLGVRFGPDKALVEEVIANSAAEKAGFQKGDLITAVGLKENEIKNISSRMDIVQVLREQEVGNSLEFTIARKGESIKLRATLGKRPSGSK